MDRFLDEAAEAGYEGLELSPRTLGDFDNDVLALHDAVSQRRLTLSGAVIAGHLEDPAAWSTLEQQARQAAIVLEPFNAKHLVLIDMLFTNGAPPPLGDEEWAILIETTHQLANLAASLGLVLAVHPHVDSHLETETQIVRFLDETDPGHVSLCLDIGQLAYVDIDPVDFLRSHHQRVSYLHLKNIDHSIRERNRQARLPWVQAVRAGVSGDLTKGVIDYRVLHEVLDEISYAGWAIAEMDRIPTSGDSSLRIARKARDHLQKIGIG